MPVLARLKRDVYRDSVELMRLSAELAGRPGVRQFTAMMATPANLDLMRAAGLLSDDLTGARPNDLCLVAEADDQASAEAALEAAEALLSGGRRSFDRLRMSGAAGGAGSPQVATARSLRGALAVRPDLNLALISVPGEYATTEARRALRAGLHVMLFSDNVSLEDEVALKEEAERLGLLCMGPDCGTALIAGVPLGFANRVRRGRIGLVGASGTGLQAVTCQIHALGEGVSHALGSGGRDLSAAVGGRTTLAAARALADDPSTEVLVVISKPGDAVVEGRVLTEAASHGKPLVVHFLGRSAPSGDLPAGVVWAETLDQTAREAVALARGLAGAALGDRPQASTDEGQPVVAESGWLAGLFTGGTLASEAARILGETLGQADEADHQNGEVGRFGRHRIVDLGDDVFTRGKPHPIIDPGTRAQAIEQAVSEGACLLLLDVVLGFGAHPDPAGALVSTLARARQLAAARGGKLAVVAAVVGTDDDPQPLASQVARLRADGVWVYETPTQAAEVAALAAVHLEPASTA